MSGIDAIQAALVLLHRIINSNHEPHNWLLGGSAGLALRGLSLDKPPNDLDLYADSTAALAIHRQLAGYAIDKQEHSTTAIYESLLSHYEIAGIRVELVGDFVVTARGSRYAVQVERLLRPYAESVALEAEGGGKVLIPLVPLAHEFIFNVLRGREDRVAVIAEEMLKDTKRHIPAFERLLNAGDYHPDERAAMLARLSMSAGGVSECRE